VDLELVDSIVQMAGPISMDTTAWAAIYSETNWPNIWVAESLLASTHDTLGLSWMVALPMTVVLMRTAMAPLHILAMREGHKMAKASPLIQDAQKAMMLSMERGASVQDAQASSPIQICGRSCCPEALSEANALCSCFLQQLSTTLLHRSRKCER
jgi:membrane protein insertase Oxa1/YidC/SpoIIIJ